MKWKAVVEETLAAKQQLVVRTHELEAQRNEVRAVMCAVPDVVFTRLCLLTVIFIVCMGACVLACARACACVCACALILACCWGHACMHVHSHVHRISFYTCLCGTLPACSAHSSSHAKCVQSSRTRVPGCLSSLLTPTHQHAAVSMSRQHAFPYCNITQPTPIHPPSHP